jgi:hypothetical protein
MLTPEQIAYNETAAKASQWRECPVCGNAFSSPGWSAWIGDWSIAGCCCRACKDHAVDLYMESRCPGCGGAPDNGFDRGEPPVPYLCTKCAPKELT